MGLNYKKRLEIAVYITIGALAVPVVVISAIFLEGTIQDFFLSLSANFFAIAILFFLINRFFGLDSESSLFNFLSKMEASLHKIERTLEPSDSLLSSQQKIESCSFEQMAAEFNLTLKRLETNDAQLIKMFKEKGHLLLLIDGLYSNILHLSSAAITGYLNPLFYGNLMEWDRNKNLLRLKYLNGLYNEQLITREFTVSTLREGVSGIAFRTGNIQIRNSMAQELKEKGEERLKAMVSIPVEQFGTCSDEEVAIINIDSVLEDVFPHHWSGSPAQQRVEELVRLLRRVNKLMLKVK